jgi:hypothetical protein
LTLVLRYSISKEEVHTIGYRTVTWRRIAMVWIAVKAHPTSIREIFHITEDGKRPFNGKAWRAG